MEPSQVSYPPMRNLTVANITENVDIINSGCSNPRLRFLIHKVVQHLHDFARETRLDMAELAVAVDFLERTGKNCTETRGEFILLADVLGLSLLVDAISHPKPPGASESTVLGPFHTHDAEEKKQGSSISEDPEGIPLLVLVNIRNLQGQPIDNVQIDVWQCDSHGLYDVQRERRDHPDGRAVLHSDAAGHAWFKSTVPVAYPVPVDGPVGELLRALSRHPYRPAHVHFMMEKEGYDHYITALTLKGDPYESHDPVFGVKDSLITTISKASPEISAKYGVADNTLLLERTFVLTTTAEATDLRAREAVEVMGKEVIFHNGLPVPSVD